MTGGFGLQQYLEFIYFGNTLRIYLMFAAAVGLSLLAVSLIGHFLVGHLQRLQANRASPVYRLLLQSVRKNLLPTGYFLSFYFSTKILFMNPVLTKLIETAVTAFVAVMAALFASNLVMFSFERYGEKKKQDTSDMRSELALKWLSSSIKFLIWVLAAILFLDNIGIKINSLIAGLGVGGIAIAFASQSIIADFFCFFTIFFDRPFEIGDFIKAGEQSGIVEHIGIKTTRIRALSGEQLVFSNTDLTSARIQNFKTMTKRRVLFSIGVTYDTPVEHLREIPAIIREIVESTSKTDFGRVHFASYGNFSLNFEIVYFILSGDYDTFMDISQSINLRIKEEFDKRGIEFAFPTQTLYLAGQGSAGQTTTIV
jgi:small-conductance mechanosensitive channel